MSKPHPLAGMNLNGPWMLSEDRIKAMFGRLRAMPRESRVSGEAEQTAHYSYSVKDGVATFNVCGTLTKYPLPEAWMDEWMGYCPTQPIMEALQRAMTDWQVTSIVFVIDSPGGMVAGTNELAEQIAIANRVKPCKAVVSDLAASGGYYIASQCGRITCNAMGEVGCIGVYCVLADWSKFYEDIGISLTVVSSGGVKGLGADGVVSQELIDDQKRGVMAMYDKFIADVAAGRNISIEQAKQLGDGRCWIATDALRLGLIDEVASVDAAMTAAIKETSSMTAEAFTKHAAENPEAAEVKTITAKGYADGKKAGEADAHRSEVDRLKAIVAVCGDRHQLAIDAFVAGQDAETVKITVAALDREAAARKAQDDKAAADLKAANDEIDRLKAASGGQGAVGTGAGRKAEETKPAEKPSDPKAAAKAEWAAKSEDEKSAFVDEDTFVRARAKEIARQS